MNEFTKEELEFLLDGIRHWSNQNIPTPWVFDFRDKIQTMIDNYCDHNRTQTKLGVTVCLDCNRDLK